MENNIAIKAEHIKKVFKVYKDKSKTLKESIIFWKRNEYEEREVLKDLSFEIKKGEAIGLIGVNGCGKSTMLKLLTRILKPTSGRLTVNGRVSSLIELGAGFHPDMTGRENIYINASIFGIKEKEIDERLNDIIEFSELEEYIDNPVRTYSSGMYMRLAFSVAINLDAEILLIDEILAVGDANFQKKCFDKLLEIKETGTTIVIVSHSLDQISRICNRVMWIEEGMIKEEGKTRLVTQHYLDDMQKKREKRLYEMLKKNYEGKNNCESYDGLEDLKKIAPLSSPDATRKGIRGVCFTNIDIKNSKGLSALTYQKGEEINLMFEYENTLKYSPKITIDFWIMRTDYFFVYGSSTIRDNNDEPVLAKERGKISLRLNDNKLLPGHYYFSAAIKNLDEFGNPLEENFDYIKCLFEIDILDLSIEEDEENKESGVLSIDHEWMIE